MKSNESNKILAVIGPTASGKTSLAIKLAKKFNGELVNTDSRQIYKYLDIGTAKGNVSDNPIEKFKIPKAVSHQLSAISHLIVYETKGVPIYLIDIIEPDQMLTLAQYQKLAYATIEHIFKKGKLPILVGGTGLYIDAIIKDYKIPKVKPDWKLRKKLNKLSVQQLQNKLQKLDAQRLEKLNRSDRNNPHRLIRQIEIAGSLFASRIPHRAQDTRSKSRKPKLKTLMMLPYHTSKQLYKRINTRAEKLFDMGLIEEVRELLDKGYDFNTPAFTAISYPLVKDFLEDKITQDELLRKIQQNERNYAKRQMTWFSRYDERIVKVKKDSEAFKAVEKFLN